LLPGAGVGLVEVLGREVAVLVDYLLVLAALLRVLKSG